MRVAVQSDLVALIAHHAAFFRKGLETVAGDEPGGLDLVFVKELEETTGADCTGPDTLSFGVSCL